jgi:hypothetical protein
MGHPCAQGAISPGTAIAVERLESAGAIVVGKTNVPVMLGDWQFQFLLFALVTVEASKDERERAWKRLKDHMRV